MMTPETSEQETGRLEHPNPEVEEVNYKCNLMCNMRASLLGVSVPPGTPQPRNPKENHTEISISYKADWPIKSGYILALVAYINPLF